MKGKVKYYSHDKGLGFITTETGEDIFTHYSYFKDVGMILKDGDLVEFEIVEGVRGKYANNVCKL
jgi:cold shock protein